MSTQIIKLGIIGLGAMGNRMVQAIQRNNLADVLHVTAICDVNENQAKEFSAQLGGIYWTTDYNKLIEEADVNLVYVAAPPLYHHPIILKAIKHGKHLFCEKPLANSLTEAAEMVAAAEKAGVVHAINFPLHYGPALNKFAELIAEGYIGKLRRIRLEMHFPHWPRKWQQNNWIASRKQGGFVLEVGVHWIQAIQKIFGQITHVQSELQFTNNPEECEQGILAKMILADGTPIIVDGISSIAGAEKIAFTAYGTEGTLSIENWGILYGGKVDQPMELLSLEDMPKIPSVLENIVYAIHGKPAEIYDFQVGYKAQVILEALRNPNSNEMIDVREDYLIP